MKPSLPLRPTRSASETRISAEGLFAWALQHEIDHLDGILYLDRLDRPEDLREVRPDDFAEEEAVVE